MKNPTFDNYFKGTKGVFVETTRPEREPDYISRKCGTDEISSQYWYGKDEGGEYVVRASDHWSHNGICGNIASCYWFFLPANAEEIGFSAGMGWWTKAVSYGKIYLKDLKWRSGEPLD